MWFQYRLVFPSFIGRNAYGTLTDFQYSPIFLFGFSVLPQKISEYFRTDVSSDANTRNMSGLCKLLNVRGFCLMPLFLSCNKHRLSMRYGPFQGLKCTISHYDMCIIRPSNGHNQNVK